MAAILKPDPDEAPPDAGFLRLLGELANDYQGRLAGLDRSRSRGYVTASGGRKIPFVLSALELRGEITSPPQLRNGMRVTFDVVNTEDGPRVWRLWTGRGPWEHPGGT